MAERQSKLDASTSVPHGSEELRIPGQKCCRFHDTLAGDPAPGTVRAFIDGLVPRDPSARSPVIMLAARVEDTEGSVFEVIKPTMP
jgi:hypothetical protein